MGVTPVTVAHYLGLTPEWVDGRLAGDHDAVDGGGLQPGIAHRIECGVGMQLDLLNFWG